MYNVILEGSYKLLFLSLQTLLQARINYLGHVTTSIWYI